MPYSSNAYSQNSHQAITMIRKNSLFIKLFQLKISSKSTFQIAVSHFRPELETCPVCGCKGNCHIHAYYDRCLIDFRDGCKVSYSLCIPRVICDNCRHTHAILPDCIIPYRSYSLVFILQVLACFFSDAYTQEAVCDKFDISAKQLHQLILLFKKHKQQWLGVLDDLTMGCSDFLNYLTDAVCYSQFSQGFSCRFAFSFLQSHRNPFAKTAPYCQKIFLPNFSGT